MLTVVYAEIEKRTPSQSGPGKIPEIGFSINAFFGLQFTSAVNLLKV
jgi:hypothetical protein